MEEEQQAWEEEEHERKAAEAGLREAQDVARAQNPLSFAALRDQK